MKGNSNNQNKVVNYEQFIDEGRKYANEKKFDLADFNINLALSCPSIDQQAMIIAYAIKSFIAAQQNLEESLIFISNKFLTKYKTLFLNNNNNLEEASATSYIRVLHRAGQLCFARENFYFAAFLYWKASNFCKNNGELIEKKEVIGEITNYYMKCMDNISSKVAFY